MGALVVDSSVAAKWVLPEDDTFLAKKILERLSFDSERPLLLDLAMNEVANAIYVRFCRKLIQIDEAQRYYADLLALPVDIVVAYDLLPRAMEMSLKYNCAIYDALFVALVELRDSDGVTADQPLARKVCGDFPRIKLLKDWKGQ